VTLAPTEKNGWTLGLSVDAGAGVAHVAVRRVGARGWGGGGALIVLFGVKQILPPPNSRALRGRPSHLGPEPTLYGKPHDGE
jgi:hypothetical protein